jgi:CelD/BcsL family acetyltransferase involved in cellulose biosynthesis
MGAQKRSNMRVAAIPIKDARWGEFASSHPSANPFHLPAWASLIADCYRFEAFVLAVRDTDGELLAGAPTVAVRPPLGGLRWVSLPFSDFCPLLVRPDVAIEDVVGALADHVLASRAQELEVRSALPAADGLHPVNAGYIHHLDLPRDPASLHPSKGNRRHRNVAKRIGVQVTRGSAAEDVATFYRLHTLTRQRLGVPVQPRRLFDLIWDRLLAAGQGFVATATLEGEAVAAVVYLSHNGTLVAKYHASDPNRRDTCAGHLVDWETTVYACIEGYHTLDLGRSDSDADGLRQYKSGWGAVESPLFYTHVSRRPPREHRTSVGGLPRRIIRSSPVWVCRAAGEVLYRWTA